MKMTPAFTVLMVGMTISIIGAVTLLFEKTPQNPNQPILTQAQFNNDSSFQFKPRKSREELKNEKKDKGNEFEKFIVQKFNKKYFKIMEWAGDKYINGIYAETSTQPDLRIKFSLYDIEKEFAVECKYRSYFYKGGIDWAKDNQRANYQNYSEAKGIVTFVAIGVGGKPDNPDELFIVPLQELTSDFISQEDLMAFKKTDFQQNKFFFDHVNGVLK
jgi:hypothetical protein